MFANALILGAFAAIASASTSSVLTFTHVPNPITDGQPQALTYATNDTSTPVTILLRHGDADNLQTVQTLTASASNGQYIWTPCGALPNGNDYALEIRQGGQVNYFGPFAIQGASASGTCSGISMTASATSSGHSSTSTASLVHHNATITSTASQGTGTALHRNTTLSSATLSKTHTSSLSSSLTTTTSPTTAGAGFQGSATPSHTNGASDFSGSSFALVLGAVAAVFLG